MNGIADAAGCSLLIIQVRRRRRSRCQFSCGLFEWSRHGAEFLPKTRGRFCGIGAGPLSSSSRKEFLHRAHDALRRRQYVHRLVRSLFGALALRLIELARAPLTPEIATRRPSRKSKVVSRLGHLLGKHLAPEAKAPPPWLQDEVPPMAISNRAAAGRSLPLVLPAPHPVLHLDLEHSILIVLKITTTAGRLVQVLLRKLFLLAAGRLFGFLILLDCLFLVFCHGYFRPELVS